MHAFDEHHSEFRGFSEHYHDHIRPGLLERDAERRTAVKRARIAGGVFLLIGLAAAVALVPTQGAWALAVLGVSAVAARGTWHALTSPVRKAAKTTLMQAVTGYLGWTFTGEVEAVDLHTFRAHFLIPRAHDRDSFEDQIEGDVHGAAFRSTEVHLEKRHTDSKGRTSYSTLFRGQLMRIDFPTRTFGRTVVLRDRGMFNRKARADMKRVGLSSPRFETLFEAYGTDQVEARVILDPAFMQRILDLEAAVSGKNIRFAFADNELLIAVETRNQFEAGSMRQPLDNPEAVQRILDEVGTLYDIVDGLVQPATRTTSQPR